MPRRASAAARPSWPARRRIGRSSVPARRTISASPSPMRTAVPSASIEARGRVTWNEPSSP
jgi:hypothetical protein